jgi:DNA-binding GntR family transcriptional regulator
MFAPTMSGDYALEPHRLIIEALKKRDLRKAKDAIEKHTAVWRALMENTTAEEV